MNRRRPLKYRGAIKPGFVLAFIAVLGVVAGLTWALQGVVRQVIVLPGAYLLNLLKAFIASVPQALFWAALVVAALALVSKSLGVRPSEKPEYESGIPRSGRRSRVGFWAIQILLSQGDVRSRISDHLSRLALDVLVHTYQTVHWQVEKRLESGELEAPAPLLACLASSHNVPDQSPAKLVRDWLNKMAQWVRIKINPNAARAPALHYPDLEIIITYLENQLEIQHEHHDFGRRNPDGPNN